MYTVDRAGTTYRIEIVPPKFDDQELCQAIVALLHNKNLMCFILDNQAVNENRHRTGEGLMPLGLANQGEIATVWAWMTAIINIDVVPSGKTLIQHMASIEVCSPNMARYCRLINIFPKKLKYSKTIRLLPDNMVCMLNALRVACPICST